MTTWMSRRAPQDGRGRGGAARTKRAQEVTQEISGWRHRLETAEKRSAELVERKEASETELATASAAPAEIAAKRAKLSDGIEKAEARRAHAVETGPYTHLTLPPNREEEIVGVAVAFKKKKR